MASISKITINGFKAFPKEFNLNLDGKNLLMYGENGSGKSSIYYALHALLQSQCHDIKKYFNKNSDECIVNTMTATPVPKVSVKFENSDITYNISENGYEESIQQPTSPIKDLNGKCVFINHKFLFNFFSFRNSQYIDLFPVFIKDILPFTLTTDKSRYISQIYDEINIGIQRKGKGKLIAYDYKNKINKFNNEVKYIIDYINTNAPRTATKIYNDFFRDSGAPNLRIILNYLDNKDEIIQNNNSYWLRLGYRYEEEKIAGKLQKVKISNRLEILNPVITLSIDEDKEDGSFTPIAKPQSYFNEAKLTAIVLSIRFSLLDTITAQDGRFLALDDMLISLDMSNRMKVIDYLLSECNQYKIYLFTHDRAFYTFIWTNISKKKCNNQWLHKRIYIQHSEPVLIDDDDDYISKAKRFYQIQDYETSAIYLRKSLEETIGNLLPYELKTSAGGGFLSLETLWQKLIKYYSDNGKSIDKNTQKVFDDSKLLILNPAAHFQRLSNPIYKKELEMTFDLHTQLSHIDRIENMLCIEKGKIFNFTHPTKPYKCDFSIDKDFILEQGDRLINVMPKCKDIHWNYNGIMYYDFEKGVENQNHPLKTATPKLNKFIEGLEKLPLEITEEIFWANCKVDNTPLKDFFGGVNITSLMLASAKNRNTKH